LQPSSLDLQPYYLFLFIVLGVAWLALICFLIGFVSGWHKLSKRFRAQAEPYGDTRCAGPFFYGVQMRLRVNYSCAIRLTAAADALYLSVLLPFRAGHPPLCIPWREIGFSRTERFWRRYVLLTLGNEERIPMRISERMARNLGILERVAGGAQTHPGGIGTA